MKDYSKVVRFLCVLILILWGSQAAAESADKTLRQLIVGTWHQIDVGPTGGIINRTFEFSNNNMYKSVAEIRDCQTTLTHQNDGSWEVSGNTIYITVRSSTRKDVPIGTRWPNQVVSINKKRIVTETPDGHISVAYKIKGSE